MPSRAKRCRPAPAAPGHALAGSDALLVACLAWFVLRFIGKGGHNLAAGREARGQEVDYTTVDALVKLGRLVLLVVAQSLGFQIAGLLALGGVGGIAVENPSRLSHRRIKASIGLRHDDFDPLAAIVADIKAKLQALPAKVAKSRLRRRRCTWPVPASPTTADLRPSRPSQLEIHQLV